MDSWGWLRIGLFLELFAMLALFTPWWEWLTPALSLFGIVVCFLSFLAVWLGYK